jgi:hypothetical protein
MDISLKRADISQESTDISMFYAEIAPNASDIFQ